MEQQDEGRWSTGHRYITSGVLQLPQKIRRAKDVLHGESTPASTAARWRKAAPARSRHQDVKGDGASSHGSLPQEQEV